jgi:hypothetical protein
MSLLGTVSSGVVVLDPGPTLPDGTRVEVRTVTGLLKFAGKAEGMPADFAAQHDHYIHGTPKR